ncbi:glycerate kinase [Alkalicoccus halolimnae]|uniref:Glycerate kinase n=1 Tax=Alkalicoccus halolimnae TaxID=1667239 RepID=A0A5C7F3G3_9BACI|nr:glycerate kinase [Alkalicoccus halolimnae]TXF85162.1 glycerate kinase [Alkalicoccus halolimnae]
MKIVIAPDSFKETLSAYEVGEAAAAGFKKSLPCAETFICPMADGGEGTVAAMVDATNGSFISADVHDPLGRLIQARYGLSGNNDTAFIEMAEASGIHLVQSIERDVRKASSYGTGELILHALNRGTRNFIIGIGGSATNDGGAGMLQSLGAVFRDKNGFQLHPGGAALAELETIDLTSFDTRISESTFRIACDVENPLTGEYGASAVYGPQKGADAEDIKVLDNALKRFATVGEAAAGVPIDNIAGAGAAGGLGAAFLGFFPAFLEKGAEIVADVVNLEHYLKQADLVVTGEGGINSQTIYGKTPIYVAALSKKLNAGIPVIALCGSITDGYENVFEHGIDAVFSTLSEIAGIEELKQLTPRHISHTAENIGRLVNLSKKIPD